MTLLITVIAAIICTLIWYKRKENNKKDPYKTSALVYMFWGASLMWLIDAIFAIVKEGAAYFVPKEGSTLAESVLNQQNFFYNTMNDLFLGLSVIVLALVIWLVIVLISDPKGVIRQRKDK